MKINELRQMSVEDLNKELISLTRELFNLRMQRGGGQMPKPHLFKKTRNSIARIKTILGQKQLEISHEK